MGTNGYHIKRLVGEAITALRVALEAVPQPPDLLKVLQAFIDGGYDREIAITAIAKAEGVCEMSKIDTGAGRSPFINPY